MIIKKCISHITKKKKHLQQKDDTVFTSYLISM